MLELLKNTEFDDVYSIMEDSFPADERRPYNEQKMLLNKDNYKVYVIKDTSCRISAFIAVWSFNDFIFIEHFAVDSSFRNSGIGSSVLNDIKNKYNKIICLEVEPPKSEITRRRVGFYERNGFYLNHYPYVQPPISKGKNPVPLMIMTTDKEISEEEFIDIKESIYKKVYNVV